MLLVLYALKGESTSMRSCDNHVISSHTPSYLREVSQPLGLLANATGEQYSRLRDIIATVTVDLQPPIEQLRAVSSR